jgi:hypothetical protein
MNPISYFDFLIKYKRPTAGRKIINGTQIRKLYRDLYPLAPQPFYQSPTPHPYFIDFDNFKNNEQGSTKASPPRLLSIGNEETILIAEYLPRNTGIQSWIPVNRIKPDQPPNYSANTLVELTQNFAPDSCYSRKLRELFSLPSFQPTHYNQSSQTSLITNPVPLELTNIPNPYTEKRNQGTQTEGMILLSFDGHLNIINTPKVQTEQIHNSLEQVKFLIFY